MSTEIQADKTIDARGSYCPGPLMELIRSIKAAQVGQVLAVLSSDAGSTRDIPLWVQKAGQEFVGTFPRAGYNEIMVRKVK